MKRSSERILTSHVGSLPRPEPLIALNRAKLQGQDYNAEDFSARLTEAVKDICRRQVELGIDVVNDGEFGKATRGAVDYVAWSSYIWRRLSGWSPGEPTTGSPLSARRDRKRFAEFYREHDAANFFTPSAPMRLPVFTGPITYTGQDALQADLANLNAGLGAVRAEEGFVTSIAPGILARYPNRFYRTEEEFLFALADALKPEYKAILDAGFVLQIDDPGMPDDWDTFNPEPSVADYKKFAMLRIEALNHALAGLPEDRIRYHICWGSWHGPHVTDLPLENILDVLLKVRAGAFSVEAGNVRHEHEWQVWQDVKLPEGKILIPGVVSHSTNVVEHPRLVSDRLVRFAQVVGRENVIAGTDCGLGGRIHEQLVWAKLEALVEGARLASNQLWS